MRAHRLILIGLLSSTIACTGSKRSSSLPPQPAKLESTPETTERRTSPASPPSGPLDIAGALRIALENSPELAIAISELEASLGDAEQAGLLPNGSLEVGVEAAPLSGKTTGDAEYRIGWTQPIPIGGRLAAAQRAADARALARLHEYRARRQEIVRSVRGAFAAALFAEKAWAIESSIATIADEAAAVAKARTDAGDAPDDERARAELEAARARLSVREAEDLRADTHDELLRILGFDASPAAERSLELTGELEQALALPSLSEALEAVSESSILLAQDTRVAASDELLRLAEAQRIPDLDVGFFYRRLEERSTNAIDVTLAVELPIFDRGQGHVRAARARAVAERARRNAQGRTLTTRLRAVHRRLTRWVESATSFREDILPRSKSVVDAAEKRYAAGETSLDESIPIRRDHRALELRYLELLREIALDSAELRSLVQVGD